MKPSAAILLALLLSGCTGSLVPEQQIVAWLPPGPERGRDYIVPDTVFVNTAFEVIVFPVLDCGSDAIPARVRVAGTIADVTARAVIPPHPKGAVFTCEGRLLNRSIGSVTFATAGQAVVRLHGRTVTTGRDTTIPVPVAVVPR